jgi:peptide/nickel transport system ATP-binding protein
MDREKEPLLQIEHLETCFFTKAGVVKAVDDVSITIPAGKTVGLVGESGCGKSMTAMSVMGLVSKPGKVTGGKVLYRPAGQDAPAQDLLALPAKARRQMSGDKLSIIFQEPMTSLNPVMTVGKQVREAILIHNKGMNKAQAKEQVLDLFRQVGIPDPVRRYASYPHQLSGGLRQRVMIAMAMACNPDLLIADEPTTALDVTIEAQILHLMRKLQQEHGTSILMITHNLGVVAEICDEVYVMYAGKVVEYSEVHELFKNTSHPYTQGLLRSLPKMEAGQEKLYNIKGMVPDLLHLPKGCRFAPRCEHACERCHAEMPPLYDIGDGHLVRCFRFEEQGTPVEIAEEGGEG